MWGSRSNAIHKALLIKAVHWSSITRLCFSTKSLITASQHATQAIHAMQLTYINHTEWNPMSDTHLFTSSFWVWTKLEAPYSSSHMSNTGERSSHMRTINKYVRTTTAATPSGQQLPSEASIATHSMWRSSVLHRLHIFDFLPLINYLKWELTRPFQIIHIYLEFKPILFMVKLFDIHNSVY